MNSNAADTNKYDYVDENQRRTDATMKTNNMTELTPEDLQLVQEVIADAIGRANLTGQLLPTLCLVAGPLADASGIKPGSVLRTTFHWPEDKAARDQVAAALREAARQADAVMSVLVLDCVAREDKSDLILVAVAKPGHNWSAAMPMAHSGQWPAVSQSLSYKYRSYEIPHGRLDFLLGPVGVTAGGWCLVAGSLTSTMPPRVDWRMPYSALVNPCLSRARTEPVLLAGQAQSREFQPTTVGERW